MLHGESQISMTPMLRSTIYTCKLHACGMFDEMHVMASYGMIKVLFNLFLWHHFFPVLLQLFNHSIMGNDLGFGPEKSGSNPGTLAQN